MDTRACSSGLSKITIIEVEKRKPVNRGQEKEKVRDRERGREERKRGEKEEKERVRGEHIFYTNFFTQQGYKKYNLHNKTPHDIINIFI